MKTRVIHVRNAEDVASAAAEGAAALRAGALVSFATETVYGVAALATCAAAMDKLRDLKDRPQRPFSVHVGRPDDIYRYVAAPPQPANQLIAKALPGPLTLLLPMAGPLADPLLRDPALHARLVYEGVIGVRCPDDPVAIATLSAVDGPVVMPSANLAGQPSPRSAQEVLAGLDGRIDLLLDSGETKYGKDSTIVNFAATPWQIVRKGVYDQRMLRKFLRRRYLFVCTGNTCRSPIAEGLARVLLAKKLGVSAGELEKHDVEVVSAGIFASDGSPVTPEAALAAREFGADIRSHRSRKLTLELINSADLVFCMTESHAVQVARMAPSARPRVRRLDPTSDIPDPIGGGAEIYRQTAHRIESALQRWIEKEVS